MVRLLHFSDLHLGVENYGRFDPDTGLSSRLGDFLAAFDRVVDYALENDVHLALFAGDAYRTCDPSPTHQREFAWRIGRLARAGVPVVLLTGNHDVPNARGRANAVTIFETLAVDNVYVASKPGTIYLETKGGPIQVVALPWLGRSILASLDEHKNKTIEEIRETIIEKAENIVLSEIEQLDRELPAVFMAHGSVFGAVYSSERKTLLGQDLVLPSSLYTHSAFDYVALGHIHKHQVLHDLPPVVYSGSLERIDFGEEKEEKGFVVAEVAKGHTGYRIVPTDARKFVTLRVEAMSQNPMDDIVEMVGRHDIREAVVRMIVHTKPELEPLIDDRACRQLLRDAFYVAAIIHDVERLDRMRLAQDSSVEALPPRELLRRYFEYKETPKDRIDVLLEHADRLMVTGQST